MRFATTVVGVLIGLAGAVGITLSQAETKIIDSVPRRVVASVTRGRVHETALDRRLLWVGIPAAVVGGGIGYLATGGVNLGAAFFGAVISSAFASNWREHWHEYYGRAGENAQVSDTFLLGLVGGLLAAAAAAHFGKNQTLPARVPSGTDSSAAPADSAWPQT